MKTASNSKAISMFSALDREIPPGPPDVPKVIELAGEYQDIKEHIWTSLSFQALFD